MKRSSLLPLVAVVFAVACTDATAPAKSHALLSPKNPDLGVLPGEEPPPPQDVAIAVTVNSPGQAVFFGVYFSKGILNEDGTPQPTVDGTAWLRFDNTQPDLGGAASINARFMVKGDDSTCPVDPSTCATGKGTLTIGGVQYTIVSVQSFTRFTSCADFQTSPCALITFTLSDGSGGTDIADLFAFDRSTCLVEGKYDYRSCPFPDYRGVIN